MELELEDSKSETTSHLSKTTANNSTVRFSHGTRTDCVRITTD